MSTMLNVRRCAASSAALTASSISIVAVTGERHAGFSTKGRAARFAWAQS